MIKRFLAEKLIRSASQYPVVTVTGPRQSGKTTLVRMVFQNYRYVSLENPDHRNFALTDPRGFLNQFQNGVILDEVQRIPELFSYIQSIVDEDDQPGKFILTGSQNFLLMGQISQSLAGRTAILHLLPFSLRELSGARSFHPDNFPDIMAGISSSDLWENLLTGFYPRIHDKNLDARDWLAWYYQTYVERDVRSVINIGDLETFGRFIRLCAGRCGQITNFSSLAADCGISNMTAKRWLSVLQTSFVLIQLRPHYENFNKRLIKAPKLYFVDTGLLAFLLGIKNIDELKYHSSRGAIFESFVLSELYKSYLNNGLIPDIYYWRDVKNHEVDFLLDRGSSVLPIEAKSGETITRDSFRGLQYYRKLAGDRSNQPVLLYGGNDSFVRHDIQVLSWQNL